MAPDNTVTNGWRSQSLVWWIGGVAVCLGFLLLAVLFSLVLNNSRAISHGDKKLDKLTQVGNTKYENLIYNLTRDRDALRDERNQLRLNASALTKEMKVLQSQYNSVVASQDKLQEEVNRLNQSLKRTDKNCHPGWTKFNNKCYYVSAKGQSKKWEDSRKDCRERRADLVIITTKAEMDFVTTSYAITWTGLSDKVREGQWKWVDGTDLEGPGLWENGEPNNSGGNEDCVEVYRGKGWNDVSCDKTLPWVCED